MPFRSSGPSARRALSTPAFRPAALAAAVVFGGSMLLAAPAVAQATAGLAVDPAGTDAARAPDRFDEARALYDGGLYGPAAQALARFRDAYPRDVRAPEALFLHADAALASGDADAAAALFAQFGAENPGSPLAPRARLALGRYYYATGDDARAEAALVAALSRPGPPESEAEAAYLLGLTALRQGRPDAALGAFERAAEADTPTAPAGLYALGTTYIGQGNAAGVVVAFERLAARYPTSAENAAVRLALAEAYLRTDRLQPAIDEIRLRRSTLTGDDAVRADLLVGETLLRLGDTAGALEPLQQIPPGGVYGRRAALATGRALYARGDVAGAAAELASVRTGAAAGAPGTTGTAIGAPDDPLALEAAYYEALALKRDGRLGDAEQRLTFVAARPQSAYGDAALLELGLLRYESRRTDAAVEAFQRLLALTPRSPYAGEGARLLGETYAAAGRTAEATEAFRLAETLGTATADTRAEVAFQDAFARYRAADYDAATDALLAVTRDFPDGERTGEALFWAGEAAFQAERYARAEEILTGFTTRFPDHRQADAGRYVLAWTFFRRRDYTAAAAGYERFLSAYTASSEAVPYVADALLRLGDSYYALRRFDDARAAYARVPAATPTGDGADYALFQTGQAFAGQGNTRAAIDAYGRLVGRYPASTLVGEALVSRAELRASTGDPEGAVADYERVVAEKPTEPAAPRAVLGIGDVRFDQGRFDAAEAAYRRALDRYPASPSAADALEGLLVSLDALGRADEVDATADAVEARTTDPEARARIRLRRALTSLEAGNAESAARRLEALLADNPPAEIDAEARLVLGGAVLALGRPADAADIFRTLIARQPDGPLAPEAQLQLVDALLASGDAAAALDAAAAFPRLYPDDTERVADALRREADALTALGRTADADARLRTLVTRYPASAAAEDALRTRPDLAPAPPPVAPGAVPPGTAPGGTAPPPGVPAPRP